MKSKSTIILLTVILAFVSIECLQVRIATPQIPSSLQEFRDRANLKLSINSADRFIYPDNKNTFVIPTLVASRNMVQVVSDIYLYPVLMIDQRPQQERKFSLLHPGTRQVLRTVQEPIVLTPIEKINYFDVEGGFSIKSVLFSGYGMMIVMGVFLYFCYSNIMPKLEQAQQAPQS